MGIMGKGDSINTLLTDHHTCMLSEKENRKKKHDSKGYPKFFAHLHPQSSLMYVNNPATAPRPLLLDHHQTSYSPPALA